MRRASSLALLAAALACSSGRTVGPAPPPPVDLLVTASVSGTSVATVVVEVTAVDIPTPIVANLTVVAGSASGLVAVPPGLARTFTARAFDGGGGVTHEGSVTMDVVPGSNPAVNVTMLPRPGEIPIQVVIGSVAIEVLPATATLAPDDTLQLDATVRGPDGGVLDVTVSWASTAPQVATVSPSGLVTAAGPGSASIVATFAGTAASMALTVQALPAAAAPTFTPAPGVYGSQRSVSLATTTAGATIRYTLDGTRPTAASPAYAGAFPVSASVVVKAMASAPGFSESPVSTALYVIESGGTTLNGHTVVLDGEGKLLSWVPQGYAYAMVVQRTWASMLRLPTGAGGRSVMWLYPYVTPVDYQRPNWPNAPGSSLAMLVDSALLSYPFTGDATVMAAVKAWIDHYLSNGLTLPTDSWASVPYNEGDPGSLTYRGANDASWGTGIGDGIGVLEPDKVAELGWAFLRFHEWDGTPAYRDAAIRCADALVAHRRTGTSASVSPWPFRVYAATNVTREAYTAHAIAPIKLFDELVRLGLGDTAAYQGARDAAWTWLLAQPMTNGGWCQYFEDMAIPGSYCENRNQLVPGNTARYLLEDPSRDPAAVAHAQTLVAWIEANFGKPLVFGARPIGEQTFYDLAMGSHTSRYGAVNALLFERTGDAAAREKAFRALNWATYMNRADGDTVDGHPQPNQIWMTDGFGDYIRHFMVAMASEPEWAPPGEDHLLRSTSVVQSVAYGRGTVSYRTFDAAAEEVLRLTFAPASVTADGAALPQRADLAAQGWTWDPAARVLRVRHDAARELVVRANPAP